MKITVYALILMLALINSGCLFRSSEDKEMHWVDSKEYAGDLPVCAYHRETVVINEPMLFLSLPLQILSGERLWFLFLYSLPTRSIVYTMDRESRAIKISEQWVGCLL